MRLSLEETPLKVVELILVKTKSSFAGAKLASLP